jgi:excisionase family DNA binding protein
MSDEVREVPPGSLPRGIWAGGRMLTTRDAAAYLGVSERSFAANWHRWGLTAYAVGRRNMYRLADLDAWLESRRLTTVRGAA